MGKTIFKFNGVRYYYEFELDPDGTVKVFCIREGSGGEMFMAGKFNLKCLVLDGKLKFSMSH
jgi:hypothetical protein